jgi:hypothetical protein
MRWRCSHTTFTSPSLPAELPSAVYASVTTLSPAACLPPTQDPAASVFSAPAPEIFAPCEISGPVTMTRQRFLWMAKRIRHFGLLFHERKIIHLGHCSRDSDSVRPAQDYGEGLSERRSTILARNKRDLVAATEIPATSAISLTEMQCDR